MFALWTQCAQSSRSANGIDWPGIMCASFMCFAPLQIAIARTARMYTQGVLLTLVSSWLLLRALNELSARWWVGYGAAMAALCYTHNYGWFTAAAHAAFLGSEIVSRRSSAAKIVIGSCIAGLVGLACIAPWLGVVLSQAAHVSKGYWIPDLTWSASLGHLRAWLGISSALPDWTVALLSLAVVGFGTLRTWRGDRTAWFLLVLAVVPVFAGHVVSLSSSSVVLQDRYLAFSQPGVFGLYALLVWTIPRGGLRFCVGVVVVGLPLHSLHREMSRAPAVLCPIQDASKFIAAQYQPGDTILVGPAGDVNRLRFYGPLSEHVRVCCAAPRVPIHIPHLASLAPDEVVPHDVVQSFFRGRVWRVSDARYAAPQPKQSVATLVERTFLGAEPVFVSLCVPIMESNRKHRSVALYFHANHPSSVAMLSPPEHEPADRILSLPHEPGPRANGPTQTSVIAALRDRSA
jgi:hypothetical protein